jgi:hypothetical protein
LSHTLGVRYSLGREHELNTHTKQVATWKHIWMHCIITAHSSRSAIK